MKERELRYRATGVLGIWHSQNLSRGRSSGLFLPGTARDIVLEEFEEEISAVRREDEYNLELLEGSTAPSRASSGSIDAKRE